MARDAVEWWRDEHVASMLAVYDAVSSVTPPLDPLGVPAVSFRPKRFESMIDKLTREPGKLADMVDIGGVRAVMNTQDEVDELHAQLATSLDIRRLRDWARHVPPSGYRAVHLHVRHDGRMIEVQLRTFGQDAWANIVEEESRLSGLNYKAGRGHTDVLAFFAAVADLMAAIELGESHPNLATRLYDAYQGARAHLQMPRLRDLEL
jgi:ppGpp synthetase/RelA/SpoT-type nucleotidyltranferase